MIPLPTLLADGEPWHHMGRRFREGGTNLQLSDLLILGAILGLVILLLWLLSKYLHNRERRPYNSPRGLFRELCRAHRLRWSQRWLLWSVAHARGLSPPAMIFLKPQVLSPAHLPPKLAARKEEITQLRAILFASGEATAQPNR